MAVDIVIVGGGIMGCTSAYYLAKKGLSIALVEKHTLGSGTTANNFSWINATSKTSDADYHRLNALGVRMYDALAKEYTPDVLGLMGSGALGLVRRSDAGHYSALRNQARELERLNYPCEWLDRESLQRLEPYVAFAEDAQGLLSPTDKTIDAALFSKFMADRVRKMGGEVWEQCSARSLNVDDDGNILGLLTDRGFIEAPRVLLAAGPDTAEVLAMLTGYEGFATRFPVNQVPGLLVTTPAEVHARVSRLMYTDSGGEFHVLPEINGGLRLASDEVDGRLIDDQSPAHLRALARGLLQRMQELVPEFAGESCLDKCKLSVGVRAYPEDGKSIAGELPGAQGLFVVATHSGITLAPALGSLMAELIVDGIEPEQLKPFSLMRLPGFS